MEDISTSTTVNSTDEILTYKMVKRLVDLIDSNNKSHLEEIKYNWDTEKFLNILGVKKVENPTPVGYLYGCKLYKVDNIPKGQVRMIDNKGLLIKIFQID